jgi:hypothetical protein
VLARDPDRAHERDSETTVLLVDSHYLANARDQPASAVVDATLRVDLFKRLVDVPRRERATLKVCCELCRKLCGIALSRNANHHVPQFRVVGRVGTMPVRNEGILDELVRLVHLDELGSDVACEPKTSCELPLDAEKPFDGLVKGFKVLGLKVFHHTLYLIRIKLAPQNANGVLGCPQTS